VRIAYKRLARNRDEKAWILAITNASYTKMHADGYEAAHSMMLNPLVYVAHRDQQPEAHTTILWAMELRATNETYTTANHQLSTCELTISQKKDYAIYKGLDKWFAYKCTGN
jgi:hypothetical protein